MHLANFLREYPKSLVLESGKKFVLHAYKAYKEADIGYTWDYFPATKSWVRNIVDEHSIIPLKNV